MRIVGLAESFAQDGKHSRRLLLEYPRLVPVAIFLLVIAVTVLSVFTLERGAQQREQAAMARTALAMSSALERRASTNASYLRAGAALFATQGDVTDQLFRRFVAELRLDADYRGSEGLGWAPVLDAQTVPDFERRLLSGLPGDATVTPSLETQPRDQAVPVMYLQPDTSRNRRAIGFDMYSEPTRRAAMDDAARSTRPTASGKVVLAQEGEGNAPGFLVYMPVFEGTGGSRKLLGFIYSPFNAQDFLSSAAELVDVGEMGVALFDGKQVGEESAMAALVGGVNSGEMIEQDVFVANRHMTLVIQSSQSDLLSAISMATLLFGIAVASLLMLVARLLSQQALEDQRSINWFAEQNSIRDSLTRELNHRVKNTLANILSIVALTRRRSDNVDEFADGIDGRIRALSATHDLLTQSEWGTTPIDAVISAELAPYAHDADHEVVSEGPQVELAPNDALSLGLAIHELATNASKFGALSRSGGRVHVSWNLVNDRVAKIRWVESGGPLVDANPERGFGMDLIEKIIAHELRHPVDLDFEPDGVRCTLMVPVRKPYDFAIRAKKRPVPDNVPGTGR